MTQKTDDQGEAFAEAVRDTPSRTTQSFSCPTCGKVSRTPYEAHAHAMLHSTAVSDEAHLRTTGEQSGYEARRSG